MTGITDVFAGPRWSGWRILMWGGAVLLLLLPATAMRFTTGVNWDETDFIVVGVMLAAACGAVELAARASVNGAYRLAAIVAVGIAFLTIWANLAIGMIGSEDNDYNLLFGGVLGLALVSSIVVRFRPTGMARAMLITAVVQAAVGLGGLPTDQWGATLSTAFSLPWLLSAALFWHSARDQSAA
jgi:hypothetical protein